MRGYGHIVGWQLRHQGGQGQHHHQCQLRVQQRHEDCYEGLADGDSEEDEENPTFELTYSGFKNDETEDVLTVKPVATTTATANSPAGDYVITVSGGEAQNYDFSYVSGTLTVTEKEIIDGIATLSLEKVQGPVYTLSGQRVEQPHKGRLYIVNGHKVVLK